MTHNVLVLSFALLVASAHSSTTCTLVCTIENTQLKPGRPLAYVAKQSQDTHATSCQTVESRQTITDVCIPDAV